MTGLGVSLILLRHAPTPWSRAGRMQGRTDVSLDAAGRAEAAAWPLAPEDRTRDWFTSPLARCRETARALGLAARIDDDLTEMNWGAWEGQTHKQLRDALGADEWARREAAGLDLRPDGGETPREVQARVLRFAARLTRPAGAVTHKGVMRAAMALAAGWDMTGAPPHKIKFGEALRFVVRDGALMPEPAA
ncbi:MAG: histidine phosphatase family protein [Rhodospirillales bacterium]